MQDKQFTAAKRKPNERGKNSDNSTNDRKKLEAIFCPPLDASLIAAIWNDTKNYASSFEILSMLAKDAPAVEDEVAESQPAITQLQDIPEDVPAEDDNLSSIPLPSEAEDEIPKIDFLMRCFPDIPRDELETALQEQDGDLQSATDIILNDMFLKEEEVSNDDADTKSDNVPGRFLNNLDEMMTDNNGQKQSRQIRKTPVQKNKKTVIWDSGGLNAASIRNGTYPQPLTLAPLEPNRWLEYEKEVSELTRLFPRLSKTVVNTTVKRFQGNLLECVDQLSRLTNTSPLLLTNQNWEELRKIHSAIDQAKLLLPGRDESEIKRLIVGATLQENLLNIQDQGEVVQMAVDLILSRERDREKEQIMIEERLQELTLYAKKEIKFDPLTGEIVSEAFPMLANDRAVAKLRAAEAAKEIRAIPEYLLIDNTEEYMEDDPEECRDIAFSLVLQRNEVYRKAADAYRRAKGKTNGEGGIAYYYSDEGRKMDVAAKEWNMRAARAIIRQHRIRQNDDHLLDLHGLTVAEAVELVKEGVNQWWSRSTMRAGRTKIKPLSIVTGIGKHSDHGQSRLYPAVMGLLTREGWKVDTTSRGSLVVTGLVASGNKRR
ncbi:hypothetical protein INT44_000682 [Umbelopsis vinacea]|uniref:Smr domain-containing protein n=1 Tax=Umbelopsis vinacea TaxID=44442 RepID=A0A8H7Q8F4_9FUNG|nr:hypothetical protein INT44_000682 [Umbelopsis vinacea]